MLAQWIPFTGQKAYLEYIKKRLHWEFVIFQQEYIKREAVKIFNESMSIKTAPAEKSDPVICVHTVSSDSPCICSNECRFRLDQVMQI